MLTKGAIGNLVNRYKAVLAKCNLINTFGSLAVASMLVLGGAGVAGAATLSASDFTPPNEQLETAGDSLIVLNGAKVTINKYLTKNATVDVKDFSAGTSITIDGAKLTGQATVPTKASSADGAFLSGGSGNNTKVIIKNSSFDNNTLTDTNASNGAYGGVIGLNGAYDVELTNVTFSGNTISNPNGHAKTQGCYHQDGGKFIANNVKFIKNIDKESINSLGGALWLYNMTEAKINDAEFSGNQITSTKDGDLYGWQAAALFASGGEYTVTNTTFTQNTITTKGEAYGGAIFVQDNADTKTNTTLTVDGAIFSENKATSETGAWGGAIGIYDTTAAPNNGTTVNIKNSTFTNNESSHYGGAIGSCIGGDKIEVFITDSSFTNNTAGSQGGAIYNLHSLTLSGTNTFSGNTAAGKPNDIHNEGTLTINGEAIFDGGISGTGTVNGSGTIVVNSADATFSGSADTADGLTAKGSANLNDQTGGDIDTLNKQLADLGIKASGMDEGLLYGAVTVNADGTTTQKPNTLITDTLEIAHAAPLALGRVVMNDVRKRMGDLRSDKNESGVWMRWDGGKLAGDEGLTNNFNTIQIGGDTKVGKNCRFGVAGAFTHGDLDHRNGNGEMETFSFSAYSTWMGENGMFADIIARVGFTNTDLTMKGNRISLDNEALSLSAEYGWRFDICQQFFVEPQVELTYTYLTGADTEVSYADYSVESLDSLIGRAGLLAGWKLPNDMGSVYARASVVNEFLGDSKLSASAFGRTVAHSLDGQDTWLEYGIGANVKLTEKTYIWADVERTAGADLDEEWRGTVGIRYSF